MSSRSGRSEVDGRFGRCVGCAVVVEVCASVHARCVMCARQRRREKRRAANQRWARTPAGRASGRRRQADHRARRRRVTDPISTEAAPSPTSRSLRCAAGTTRQRAEQLPDEQFARAMQAAGHASQSGRTSRTTPTVAAGMVREFPNASLCVRASMGGAAVPGVILVPGDRVGRAPACITPTAGP